jgi:hypothetical protein
VIVGSDDASVAATYDQRDDGIRAMVKACNSRGCVTKLEIEQGA